MKRLFILFMGMMFLASNSWATVGWNRLIPATSENPQAISPDVIENNTALDLMLQDYRSGHVSITLVSTSEIDIGTGGVMLQNSGGSVRLMVANTTVTAMSSTNIDTGSISPSSTYYIYAYASSTTATTFSVIYSASSVSPTGITYYARLGSFKTDGSSNFVSVTNDVLTQKGMGGITSVSCGTPYQAATDGFLMVYDKGPATSSAYIAEGVSSPSTTVAYYGGGNNSFNMYFSLMAAVPKGYYYEYFNMGSATCYFISIGT